MKSTRYVIGFIFNEDLSEVLLIRKNRPEWQKGRLNGIGGKVEHFDSTLRHACIREVLEESGLATEYNEWNEIHAQAVDGYVIVSFYTVLDNKRFHSYHSRTDEEVVSLPINYLLDEAIDIPLVEDVELIIKSILKIFNKGIK